jgi:hypothetical protein
MRPLWIIIIAANLAAVLGLAVYLPQPMLAPGPVMAAHAPLGENCFACHIPWQGASAERCIACHDVAKIGLRRTTGQPLPQTRPAFHQALTGQDCLACHTDHQPPALTGVARISFSHALLRPALREDCRGCHTPPATALHRGATANCSSCHTTEAWRPATFDHARLFRLEGEHNATCATCHVNDDTSRYTCFGCHEHQPAAIARRHQREGIRDFTNCVGCHRSAYDSEGGEGRRGRRERD